MPSSLESSRTVRWFVMRDLKRANSKQPAYQFLLEKNLEVFTPMKWKIGVSRGQRFRKEVPCITDLLFVHDCRENLDPLVEIIPTLQYRWVRNRYREPMVVSDGEMERFIGAVRSSETPRFYLPEEITPEMLNRPIRIVGGPLDGYEGTLVTTRGSKVKRLLVELPSLLSVAVEVNPDYIQFL